ncbi:hypothetical protein FA09DRAFT_330584 [Tilletiopsis washingtonensis]|jgi:hypothetical protein|uniref:Uncharacterized protein n=1 Tax=Tilletiopsis washingtonensis TaxID=58919 RepID=A0A316Z902_9BASI|nr:hypothetical protein FA09DRAFT_330584 [Tilletiopsis washingtonensis]PWN97422.1 hypothetical protein FA09DRAFT_330584 [Tilletiopsis washingtonensis]
MPAKRISHEEVPDDNHGEGCSRDVLSASPAAPSALPPAYGGDMFEKSEKVEDSSGMTGKTGSGKQPEARLSSEKEKEKAVVVPRVADSGAVASAQPQLYGSSALASSSSRPPPSAAQEKQQQIPQTQRSAATLPAPRPRDPYKPDGPPSVKEAVYVLGEGDEEQYATPRASFHSRRHHGKQTDADGKRKGWAGRLLERIGRLFGKKKGKGRAR